jgi:hypothetical protein
MNGYMGSCLEILEGAAREDLDVSLSDVLASAVEGLGDCGLVLEEDEGLASVAPIKADDADRVLDDGQPLKEILDLVGLDAVG